MKEEYTYFFKTSLALVKELKLVLLDLQFAEM